jgi:hypothetical protein
MVGDISVRSLISLLETAPADYVSVRARKLASEFDPEARLPIATQSAATTAETFQFKYSMATNQGAIVLCLDDLTNALRPLGEARVRGCLIQGQHEFALVFLMSDKAEIVGVLFVSPALDLKQGTPQS